MTTWQFTTPPSHPRAPEVVLVAFSRGPLAMDVPLSLATFGAPSQDALEACEVRTIAHAANPGWVDGWRQGSLRTIAAKDLGDRVAELDVADHAHVIISKPSSPADLAYLQAAWALARYLAARGASIVLDAHAMTYLASAALPPAGAALDVAREVRVVFETDSTRADHAHALHTRGMQKFGAPDLIALCSEADAALVGHAIAELADSMARGAELATPRHAAHVAPGITWVAVEDEHHLAALLQLNNCARVLVDDTGHDLVGVAARLRTITS